MYRSGIAVTELLHTAAGTLQSRLLQRAVDRAVQGISRGEAVSTSLAAGGVFPPLVTRMLSVGESTGALDHAFNRIADFYQREADVAVNRLEQCIGPALIIVVGILLVWVVMAVLGPIYDLVFGLQGAI